MCGKYYTRAQQCKLKVAHREAEVVKGGVYGLDGLKGEQGRGLWLKFGRDDKLSVGQASLIDIENDKVAPVVLEAERGVFCRP